MTKPVAKREIDLERYTLRWERYSDGSCLLYKLHTGSRVVFNTTAYSAVEMALIINWERDAKLYSKPGHNNPGLAQGI